jgi:carbamoyltransferase
MKHTLSIYGSHDASAAFIDKNGNLKILEYERFVKKRYAMYSAKFDYREKDLGTDEHRRVQFIQYIKSQLSDEIRTILYNGLVQADLDYLKTQFVNAEFKLCGHHMAHAASGYFPSMFDNAIIFSVDGGGVDHGVIGYTKIFSAKQSRIELLDTPNINLGVAYGRIGCPISEINPGPDSNRDSLVYAGKVMGLCAYGNIRPSWIEPMKKYYRHHSLEVLGNDIGLSLTFNSLKGQDSFDLAATSQHVFEELLLNIITPYVDDNDNFVLVGGCALNVLFNQKLKKYLSTKSKQLYVPSNPNDCGLALGQFLLEHPDAQSNVYGGFDILDRNELQEYIESRSARAVSVKEITDLVKAGKIIGLVYGYSEVGPRALGNRSIICDPSIADMKDILNAKVKFREWFRPFAPVCRLQDKSKYFDNVYDSEFMSYAPGVKDEFRSKLKSISHADGTARLQTVTDYQHEIFYDILTELDDRNEIPVILNTSFNIKGKPILTTIQDALYCLDNTEMDYVVIENWLFKRK